MLERISNISLEVDFKKSGKKKYSSFKGRAYTKALFDVDDTISFSPASKYLVRAKWVLKDFNQSADDTILLGFFYCGYNFEVSLNLKRASSIETIVYVISRDNSLFSEEDVVIATLKTTLGGGSISLLSQKELSGLDLLFQRFNSLDLRSELNTFNHELIDTLLEGIYTLLQNDFSYLNYVLLNFLEKQTNIKLGCLLERNKRAKTELSLLKIKPSIIH